MKIIFLEFTGRGGIYQYSNKYCEKLLERNIDSSIITSKSAENIDNHVKRIKIEPYSGIYKFLFNLKKLLQHKKNNTNNKSISKKRINTNSLKGTHFLWKKIVMIIKKERPNILHIQWIWDFYPEQIRYLQEIKKMGIKIFFTFHNSMPHDFFNGDVIKFYKELDTVTNQFFCHSNYDKEIIMGNYAIKDEKINVFSMGTPIEFNDIEKKKEDDLILLFFGFIRKYKGLDQLLKVFEDRKFKDKNIRLKIVGEAKEKDIEYYKKLMKKSSIPISFDYHYKNDQEILDIFENVDFLILPYINATQTALIPLSYHLKTPVIVSNVGGLPEFVKNGKTGFIVKEPFVTNLKELLSKNIKSMADEMSKSAIIYYQERMDWDSVIKRYSKHLQNSNA